MVSVGYWTIVNQISLRTKNSFPRKETPFQRCLSNAFWQKIGLMSFHRGSAKSERARVFQLSFRQILGN
jgi:hypothetical protein